MDYDLSPDIDTLAPKGNPIRNLIAATLSRAILDRDSTEIEVAKKACKWIREVSATPDDPIPWTFHWCCVQLEINPYELRSALKKNLVNVDKLRHKIVLSL